MLYLVKIFYAFIIPPGGIISLLFYSIFICIGRNLKANIF